METSPGWETTCQRNFPICTANRVGSPSRIRPRCVAIERARHTVSQSESVQYAREHQPAELLSLDLPEPGTASSTPEAAPDLSADVSAEASKAPAASTSPPEAAREPQADQRLTEGSDLGPDTDEDMPAAPLSVGQQVLARGSQQATGLPQDDPSSSDESDYDSTDTDSDDEASWEAAHGACHSESAKLFLLAFRCMPSTAIDLILEAVHLQLFSLLRSHGQHLRN